MIYDSEEDRTVDNLVKIAFIVMVFVIGVLIGKGVWMQDHPLVQCQEDEVWYPEDFTGSEAPEDLICIHRDAL